jgi:hypothetical protein
VLFSRGAHELQLELEALAGPGVADHLPSALDLDPPRIRPLVDLDIQGRRA